MKKWVMEMGFVSSIFSISLVFISALISKNFSWENNYLSDIGAKQFGFIPYIFFTIGMITGGLLLSIYFIITIYEYKKHKGMFFSESLFLISSISMTMIAVFPEGSPDNLHYIFSFIFFLIFPVGMIFTGIIFYKYLKKFSQGTFMLASLAFLLDITILIRAEKASSEMLVSFIIFIWFLLFNYLMFKITNLEKKNENNENK
ncbi:MAG: DUF998 domain-containing protein [Thermoplasmata archaeon]